MQLITLLKWAEKGSFTTRYGMYTREVYLIDARKDLFVPELLALITESPYKLRLRSFWDKRSFNDAQTQT